MNLSTRAGLALLAYVLVVVSANVATSTLGLIQLPLGLTVAAGTFAAGLALCFRDVLHDAGGLRLVLVGILLGTVASFATASGRIAVASAAAFLLAELLDLAVYTPLRRRGWNRAVLASNLAGGIVDSAVFLALSGLGLTLAAVSGQVAVKLAVTVLFLAAAGVVRRAVLRERLEPAGA